MCDSEEKRHRTAVASRARMGKKRWRGEQKSGETNKRMRWFSERGSFPSRHCIFLTCRTHRRGLPPGGTERDEMQPRTEWIINVKISFPTESNKLPMIWLSERLVGRIRETPGSRGGMSSLPRVIDSCAVSTFLVVVIKGARARHGAWSLGSFRAGHWTSQKAYPGWSLSGAQSSG